ncbi:uncharacterized protein TRAVEDRAFT_151007, partial [Trametes versicolor FP-101664 SS1]|uniref:uncharacterized protein n=1 Tax=Trametes versicolor (strain FP-101664) TaxID=717944 RepID=UPI00046236D6
SVLQLRRGGIRIRAVADVTNHSTFHIERTRSFVDKILAAREAGDATRLFVCPRARTL